MSVCLSGGRRLFGLVLCVILFYLKERCSQSRGILGCERQKGDE